MHTSESCLVYEMPGGVWGCLWSWHLKDPLEYFERSRELSRFWVSVSSPMCPLLRQKETLNTNQPTNQRIMIHNILCESWNQWIPQGFTYLHFLKSQSHVRSNGFQLSETPIPGLWVFLTAIHYHHHYHHFLHLHHLAIGILNDDL